MNFDRVLNGIVKYMDREIFAHMNDWQEVLGRIAMSRLLGNNNLKETLTSNPYIKTFAIIDENGNVDVEGLRRDLKTLMQSKGKIEVTLPMFGTFVFKESDVDNLYNYIVGG